MNVASTGQPVSFDPADANLVVNEYTEYDCYDTLLDFNQDGTDVVPTARNNANEPAKSFL